MYKIYHNCHKMKWPILGDNSKSFWSNWMGHLGHMARIFSTLRAVQYHCYSCGRVFISNFIKLHHIPFWNLKKDKKPCLGHINLGPFLINFRLRSSFFLLLLFIFLTLLACFPLACFLLKLTFSMFLLLI